MVAFTSDVHSAVVQSYPSFVSSYVGVKVTVLCWPLAVDHTHSLVDTIFNCDIFDNDFPGLTESYK